MIIIFDCESTGLPVDWKAPMSQLNNWPRVIQLAWIKTDMKGNELTRGEYLIKPDGWEMPSGSFWVDNGFTQMESMTLGAPISDVLDLFIKDIETSEFLVSHNMSFDYNVVGSEMLRAGKKSEVKLKRICTKEAGTDICQIPGPYNKFKWPKLEELHQFLFKKGFDGAHDALSDVIACKDCFFKLIEQCAITLN